MTNEEAEALGRRALAAGFQDREVESGSMWTILGPLGCMSCRPSSPDGLADAGWWPDLRDWATLGVLVGQVREKAGDPTLCSSAKLFRDGKIWWFVSGENGLETTLYTIEAESWVAVLEAS
jgi:hypothetical protein